MLKLFAALPTFKHSE